MTPHDQREANYKPLGRGADVFWACVEVFTCVHLFLGVALVATVLVFDEVKAPISLAGLGPVQIAVVMAVFTPWFAYAIFATDILAIYIVERERTRRPLPFQFKLAYMAGAGGIGACYLGLLLLGANLGVVRSASRVYAIGGLVTSHLVGVTFVLLPLLLVLTGIGLFRRRRLGCCRQCGYDLRNLPRAQVLRCPECGRADSEQGQA